MGFTPQSGLLQGSRVGDIDPFVLPYVMAKRGLTLEQALGECTTNGGLLGLSGVSADMRDINESAAKGNPRAQLARKKFIYDIKRYVGQYLVLLEGVDAITFTGGIGQKDPALRAEVVRPLYFLGLRLDEARNIAHERRVSADNSAVAVLVLDTNEEIVVARETARLIRTT
jgi:acetate kinase